MKTKNCLETLKTQPLEKLSTVKVVMKCIVKENDGSFTYQGAKLKKYNEALIYLKSNYVQWIETVETCLLSRIKFQDTDLITHAITLLATNGWERTESPSLGYNALDAICERFNIPLESAGIDCSASTVNEEWNDMLQYSKTYLNLVQEHYITIWWKLFNSFDAHKWSNILGVIELLFCLPMANGHLERVFSQLKFIKTKLRTCLGENQLDDLMRIQIEGPPLSEWDATGSINLWLKEKARRVNQLQETSNSTQSTSASTSVITTESASDEDEVCGGLEFDDWVECRCTLLS